MIMSKIIQHLRFFKVFVGLKPNLHANIPPYKESNFFKERQKRLKLREDALKKVNLSDKINHIDMMDDAEKARITSEFNTNLSKEQQKRKNIRKAVGNYYYTAKNNGFNNYEFTGRYLIDDLYR